MNTNPRRTLWAATLGVLLLASSGCEECRKCPEDKSTQVEDLSAQNTNLTAQLHVVTDYPQVPLIEFNCITGDFHRHFKIKPIASPLEIKPTEIMFTKTSYEDMMEDITCAGTAKTGVLIHYGLLADRHITMAFSPVCLDDPNGREEYSFDPTIAPIYRVVDKVLTRTEMTSAQWWSSGNPGALYKANVVVKRSTVATGFDPFLEGFDATGMVFQGADEIDKLIADNSLKATEHIEVVPTAEPTVRSGIYESNFQHGACFVTVGSKGRNLDNDPTTGFKSRGADLGSPCPPSCVLATFSVRGLAPRESCRLE
jgi:outer membrane murein-binding lipoprotein Lpp